VDSLPELRGNNDLNEISADITPYARTIDGINPSDEMFYRISSGGITTTLILPGYACSCLFSPIGALIISAARPTL
jgi:hypothetical protein